MHDVRGITAAGFAGIGAAALAMAGMLADLVGARVGIWIVTVSLGAYGVALGLGRWIDVRAEAERRQDAPR
jgi:hypothetical protein